MSFHTQTHSCETTGRELCGCISALGLSLTAIHHSGQPMDKGLICLKVGGREVLHMGNCSISPSQIWWSWRLCPTCLLGRILSSSCSFHDGKIFLECPWGFCKHLHPNILLHLAERGIDCEVTMCSGPTILHSNTVIQLLLYIRYEATFSFHTGQDLIRMACCMLF